MARFLWALKWCSSYKKTTIIVCSINIVAALYVLHSLYSSLYLFSDRSYAIEYTEDQIKRMEDSIRVRRAAEPIELVRLVKQINEEFSREDKLLQLSPPLKHKLAEEMLLLLKGLDSNTSEAGKREALEIWRNDKIKEVKQLELGNATMISTILKTEAEMLKRTLESDWDAFLEYIGVWIPVNIINKEHDDKPEDEDDLEGQIIPGRPLPPECHAEPHTDYGGAAVKWGLTHHKESAADCCQACLDQAKHAKQDEIKCNVWVYCPSETGCHSPDIYEHKHQECWLKQAEKPKLTFKDKYSESYRNSHPSAPRVVPWISGVVSI